MINFKKSILIISCIVLYTACDFFREESHQSCQIESESIWLLDTIVSSKESPLKSKIAFPIVVFDDVLIPKLNFYPVLIENKENKSYKIDGESYLRREESGTIKNNFFDAANEKILGNSLKVECKNDSSLLIRVLDENNHFDKGDFFLKKINCISHKELIQKRKTYWTAEDDLYSYEIYADDTGGLDYYFGFRLNKKDSTWIVTYYTQTYNTLLFPFYTPDVGLDYLLPLNYKEEGMEVLSMSFNSKKILFFKQKKFESKSNERVLNFINEVSDTLKIRHKSPEYHRLKKIGPIKLKFNERIFFLTPSKSFLFERIINESELMLNENFYHNNIFLIKGKKEDLFILKK